MEAKPVLSVNINKIATLRNARGKNTPHLEKMTQLILDSGALGITVHPRPDERHIRYQDVPRVQEVLKNHSQSVEYNIEGYPSKKFLDLIVSVLPHQCTLVPDPPHVLTSNAGWRFQDNQDLLVQTVALLKKHKVRTSLFLDPFSMDDQEWEALCKIQPERIELYTEKYAEHWGTEQQESTLSTYQKAAQKAVELKIQVNAGHDLNLKNLPLLIKNLPQIQEVSIGQALIAEALVEGLPSVIKNYLKVLCL